MKTEPTTQLCKCGLRYDPANYSADCPEHIPLKKDSAIIVRAREYAQRIAKGETPEQAAIL